MAGACEVREKRRYGLLGLRRIRAQQQRHQFRQPTRLDDGALGRCSRGHLPERSRGVVGRTQTLGVEKGHEESDAVALDDARLRTCERREVQERARRLGLRLHVVRATSSFALLERKSSANQPLGSDPLTLPFAQPPVRVVLGVVRVVLGFVRVGLGVIRVVRGFARVVLGVVRRGGFELSGAFFELVWELLWVLFWHLLAVF